MSIGNRTGTCSLLWNGKEGKAYSQKKMPQEEYEADGMFYSFICIPHDGRDKWMDRWMNAMEVEMNDVFLISYFLFNHHHHH